MKNSPGNNPRGLSGPVMYDRRRGKFILYGPDSDAEVVLATLEGLQWRDLKKLVVERLRRGPALAIQSLSGRCFGLDDIISEIERETEFGILIVENEVLRLKRALGALINPGYPNQRKAGCGIDTGAKSV